MEALRKDAELVREFVVDTAILKEIRKIEEQVARELSAGLKDRNTRVSLEEGRKAGVVNNPPLRWRPILTESFCSW